MLLPGVRCLARPYNARVAVRRRCATVFCTVHAVFQKGLYIRQCLPAVRKVRDRRVMHAGRFARKDARSLR